WHTSIAAGSAVVGCKHVDSPARQLGRQSRPAFAGHVALVKQKYGGTALSSRVVGRGQGGGVPRRNRDVPRLCHEICRKQQRDECHGSWSARQGSIDEARQAGISAAAVATSSIRATTVAIAIGSRGPTSYSWPCSHRPVSSAPATPIASPAATGFRASQVILR